MDEIKPCSFVNRNEISKTADAAEARAEAKKEAEREAAEKAQTIRIVFGTSGTYPDGTSWERDATPEEQKLYEELTE